MTELDIYVYCFDNTVFEKLKRIQLCNTKCNIYQIRCYHTSPIPGLVTENIFERVFPIETHCRMVSQNITNPKQIIGIAISPEGQNIQHTLPNFVTTHFHNQEYLQEVLGNAYFEIFTHSKMTWSNNDVKNKIKEHKNLMKIEENYKDFINANHAFPMVKINVNEIETFIEQFDTEYCENMQNKFEQKTTTKEEIFDTQDSSFKIKYLSFATIGMGDFIQRFERLYKLMNFSDVKFIPIKDQKYSYKNEAHGKGEYLTMYDFPGYDFIEAYESIENNNVVEIQFQNLFEIFMYNKNYFRHWDKEKILLMNLGSYIVGINNRPYVGKMFNWTNDQKVIKECPVPYTRPEWELEWKSENKLILLHFRRGDYVNQFLSNMKNPRTMSSFQHILKNIKAKEEVLDAVIISDHFDMSKIPEHKKMCIPIFFDYDSYEINSTIPFGTNQKLIIRDKVLGVDGNSNLKSLKYISKCDYHIGNMSCFPVITGKIFNKKKIVHMQCQPDIKNWGDVIVREPTVP